MSLISTYQSRKSLFAEKLITKGVEASATDGLTTLINKIDDIQSFTEGLLLYADKKIAQSEDTVNLYALLLEDNVAVSGETVRFYSDIPFTTTSITEGSIALGDDYWVSTSSTGNCWIGIGGSKGYIQFTSTTIQIYISSWSQTYYYTGKFHIKDEVLTYTDMNGETQTIDLTGVGTSYSYGATNPFTVEYFWKDAVTNSEGIATIDYDCTGSGLREFYATYGSIVSETLSVDDTYKYDLATITKHTDFWTKVYGDEEFTRGAEYSTLTEGTTGSASIRTILPFNEWEVVFDAKNNNATSEWIVGLYQYGVGVTGVGLGLIDTWTNIRLVYDGTNVKIYRNGEYWLTREVSFDKIAPVYFQFQTPGTVTTIDFKNFKVYGAEPISISDTGIEGTATNIYDNVTANALTRTTEYTSLKEVTTGTNVLAYISNLPSAFVMDFELYQVDGPTGTGIINIYSDSTYKSYFSISYISETVGKWLNLRLYVSEGTAILLNKDNLKYTRTNTFTGTVNRVAFVTGGDTSELRWKNVQVHPI